MLPELLTLGETMAAFTPMEPGFLRYADGFRLRMAGAESNVAIGAAKLGVRAGWMSDLGDDEFGRYIARELAAEGVDTARVRFSREYPTGVMFKQLLSGRETRVFYYRSGSAASHMRADSLDSAYFAACRLFHATGITPAISREAREALLRAIGVAKEAGALVSVDPNVRLKLWTAEEARTGILELLRLADIALPGLDECALLFGEGTPEEYVRRLRELGVRVVALKLGEKGALVADGDGLRAVAPFPAARIVDPVGAGDAFAAGFLTGVLEAQPLETCGAMGCAMGAAALSVADDWRGLPDRRGLDAMLAGREEVAR